MTTRIAEYTIFDDTPSWYAYKSLVHNEGFRSSVGIIVIFMIFYLLLGIIIVERKNNKAKVELISA